MYVVFFCINEKQLQKLWHGIKAIGFFLRKDPSVFFFPNPTCFGFFLVLQQIQLSFSTGSSFILADRCFSCSSSFRWSFLCFNHCFSVSDMRRISVDCLPLIGVLVLLVHRYWLIIAWSFLSGRIISVSIYLLHHYTLPSSQSFEIMSESTKITPVLDASETGGANWLG